MDTYCETHLLEELVLCLLGDNTWSMKVSSFSASTIKASDSSNETLFAVFHSKEASTIRGDLFYFDSIGTSSLVYVLSEATVGNLVSALESF